MVFIGLISYPLYLWHWVLFALFKINEGVITTNASLILIALSFILATLTYIFIERRVQAAKNFLPALIGISAALASFALVTMFNTPAIDNNDYPQLTAKCYENAQAPKQLDWCYGQKNMVHSHAIVGDSHADHLFYGIAKANNTQKGYKLIGEGWCNFYLGQNLKVSKKNDCSDAIIENVLAQLKSEKKLETIIFASTAQYTPQSFGYIAKTIDYFEDSSINLIFVLDTPAMQVDIRQCGVRKAQFYKILPENPNCAIDPKLRN